MKKLSSQTLLYYSIFSLAVSAELYGIIIACTPPSARGRVWKPSDLWGAWQKTERRLVYFRVGWYPNAHIYIYMYIYMYIYIYIYIMVIMVTTTYTFSKIFRLLPSSLASIMLSHMYIVLGYLQIYNDIQNSIT